MADDNKEKGKPPIRPRASADSSEYFSKKREDIGKTMRQINQDYFYAAGKNGIVDRLENKERLKALDKLGEEAKKTSKDYERQGRKGEKAFERGVGDYILRFPEGAAGYDKYGRSINPLSSKKEIKPAAIVAPVKRPSEAVMKKLTGK
jgi:hypothetical protein